MGKKAGLVGTWNLELVFEMRVIHYYVPMLQDYYNFEVKDNNIVIISLDLIISVANPCCNRNRTVGPSTNMRRLWESDGAAAPEGKCN